MNRVYVLVIVLSFMASSSMAAFAGEGAAIRVRADQVVGQSSMLLAGACIEDVNHEIYGGLYSQMIFGESFQEPPPAPDIQGFKSYGTGWGIEGDTLRLSANDGPKLLREGNDDIREVSVDVLFPERKGHNAGLIVRVERPEVGADRWFGYEVSLEPERQGLHLARHRNNYEPLQSVPCAVPINHWITLDVKLQGSSVNVSVDGKTVLQFVDDEKALLKGAVGLRGWQSQARFRNFQVKTDGQLEVSRFQQTSAMPAISGMWRSVTEGEATGRYKVTQEKPFVGVQSQRIEFLNGRGRWGVENQGLNRWGLSFVVGKPYDGYVWVRSDKPSTLFASLESRDGAKTYASTRLEVTHREWQRLDFTLTPNASDKAGRFVLALKEPGAIEVGHAFVQPGEWGRFAGLPVRLDVVQGLMDQGITVLRYGGSMINHPGYRWKKMIGPRDRRPPYAGTWYPYSSNGWGIVDFMQFCEAAGFEYIPAFNMDESPQDMADFIDYAKSAQDTEWGRKRVADGHPKPYKLRYIELGNEERIDENYVAKFRGIAKAIWAKDRDVILVVGDFAYDAPIVDPWKFTGTASGITTLAGHQAILKLGREHQREVWFDVHLGTDGPGASNSLKALPSFIDALANVAEGARHKVVVFEYNSGNHAIRRALGNAVATNFIERDGRIPIVTSANGLQPDGQNDNGWDQGLLFLNPSQVWLQPPGYLTQMWSRNFLPRIVKCEATGALDVVAKGSEDGKTLVLLVVNISDEAIDSALLIEGFVPRKTFARVTTLTGPLNAVNTAAAPNQVIPRVSEWEHHFHDGKAEYQFAPRSVTVLRWE